LNNPFGVYLDVLVEYVCISISMCASLLQYVSLSLFLFFLSVVRTRNRCYFALCIGTTQRFHPFRTFLFFSKFY
jgi:hypothetical protein